LAKVKNFKDEKETIAIAKTPGHRKDRKVIESLRFDWSIKVHSKPNENILPDDLQEEFMEMKCNSSAKDDFEAMPLISGQCKYKRVGSVAT